MVETVYEPLSVTHFKPAAPHVGIFLACQSESLVGGVHRRQGPGVSSDGSSATPIQRLFSSKPI